MARRLSLGVVLSAILAAPAAAELPSDPCSLAPAGVKCQLGGGRTTEGGKAAGKVSHEGWPAVTGVLWVLDHNGRSGTGTELNDELLGGHGSDALDGGAGNDIIWGDMWPTANNTWQRDRLIGGAGNDWLYASHGRNVVVGGRGRDTIWSYWAVRVRIRAGDGNDRIWAKHGSGRIDCGPGRDRVRVPLSGYSLSGCEIVRHYCAFGPDGHGGCNHGSRAVIAARRR